MIYAISEIGVVMLPVSCLEKIRMTSGVFPMKAVTNNSKKHKLDCNEIQLAKKRYQNNDGDQVHSNFQNADDVS